MRAVIAVASILALAIAAQAAEHHVALSGKDSDPGTAAAPLRTIQRGAELAQPGDVITVHEGIYRERINPPRGGESDARRITYQAAPGEKVEVRGSEVVKEWTKVQEDVWKATVPNALFGAFNPFADEIRGDWFNAKGRKHHTGSVYLNGEWLAEAAKQEDVLKFAGSMPLWFAQVEKESTTIWAQFKGVDPKQQLVEINVRRTVFYPDKPGRNFITIRGFAMRHAATNWAPPTAEQIGLIGTHWSKGWIIENNTVSHSVCSGIALGKYGDEFDNTSADSAEGYVKTIERGLANGWNKETVGHHIVRNNTVSHCEQAGIVGSLGPIFCTVTGNTIHDIHVRKLFTGAEMAGIKFHGAIDTEISGNHIYRTCRGLWLDWMAQGTRVHGNLFHDNEPEDVFVEVNHGPFLLENNILLSPMSVRDWSHGGAYVHNLIAGRMNLRPELSRQTPFLKPHSTEVAGLKNIPGGDSRFYNNIFLNLGLAEYDTAKLPVFMGGNVFLAGAKPSKHEADAQSKPELDPKIKVVQKADGWYLEMALDKGWAGGQPRKLITTEALGKAAIPNLPYEKPDGTPLRVDTDYFGKPRAEANPTPGPFETPGEGTISLKVR